MLSRSGAARPDLPYGSRSCRPPLLGLRKVPRSPAYRPQRRGGKQYVRRFHDLSPRPWTTWVCGCGAITAQVRAPPTPCTAPATFLPRCCGPAGPGLGPVSAQPLVPRPCPHRYFPVVPRPPAPVCSPSLHYTACHDQAGMTSVGAGRGAFCPPAAVSRLQGKNRYGPSLGIADPDRPAPAGSPRPPSNGWSAG